MTKQHILQEIKRVALANVGKSLGRSAFYNLTGIKESDWFGKYWSRWSEAVSEAGLTPNQMTTGYEEDFLIGRLVELSRELGHIPVSGELRLRAFQDKSFPSMSTFENRFGSKGELIAKIARHCAGNEELSDVRRMCEEASSKGRRNRSEEELESSDKIGFVYLIKSGKFYKIGKTNSIGRREYDLAIQLAEKPTTVHIIKTDDPDGVEVYWHRRFAAKRKNGEWFDLNAADVKAFKKWLRIA